MCHEHEQGFVFCCDRRMAADMQAYAKINVLVVATENITTEWYRGESCLAGRLLPYLGVRVDCS